MMVGQGRYFELWDSGVWAAKLGQALAGRGDARRPAWRTFRCEAATMHDPGSRRAKRSKRWPSTRTGIYVDGTFGRGGHSRAILARLGPRGRLIALDRDPEAAAGRARASPIRAFPSSRTQFSELSTRCSRPQRVDGMLFDLGVSSPQLDDPARGFSFRADGPLDMRMDPSARRMSAANGSQPQKNKRSGRSSGTMAKNGLLNRLQRRLLLLARAQPIVRTRQLADLVAQAVRTREPGQDPATRTFQALRIHVNRELEEVSLMLPAGGRAPRRRAGASR